MPSFQILIVDDFKGFRRFISLALQKRAELHVIGEASDGLEAVQKAQELRPDLILLDLGLPNLSGIEVARRVRKLVPRAKILFFSVESSPDLIREALSTGALGYVHKPRAESDLLPAIEAVLAGKRFVSANLEISQSTNAQAPHRHEIVFCSDDEAVLDSLTRFIATALKVDNPVIVNVTEGHRQSLLQRLRNQGVAVDAAMQQGTCVWLNANEAPDPVEFLNLAKTLIEAVSTRGSKRHPPLALCGERAGLLWAEGKPDAALQLEQLCNELAISHDADILCTYPLGDIYGKETDEAFQKISAEHSAVHSR